jgi:hypothetical protein
MKARVRSGENVVGGVAVARPTITGLSAVYMRRQQANMIQLFAYRETKSSCPSLWLRPKERTVPLELILVFQTMI